MQYSWHPTPVSYTHLRAHETVLDLVCRLLLEKKKSCIYLGTVRDMYRTIYALYANYIASACSPMTPLELQQLFIYHNDHMWLSRTVPCCIYTIPRSDMTYGDSPGQCVCRLWYSITSCRKLAKIATVRDVNIAVGGVCGP